MADPIVPAPLPTFRDSHNAPFIYFDFAPSYGVFAGAVEIELVARTLVPSAEPAPKAELLTTGRIRCSPAAAVSLRDAINNVLDLIQKLQEQAGATAEGSAAPKLN